MRQTGIAHPPLPLPPNAQSENLEAFHCWLSEAIPLVPSLGIKRMRWQGEVLNWDLALSANLNDKGTGFGGGLAAQTTLIGWCWVTLWLRAQGRQQDVVVADAGQRFLAPVRGDYRLVCRPRDAAASQRLDTMLAEKGRGRIALLQELYCGDTLCLQAQGDYVVLPSTTVEA